MRKFLFGALVLGFMSACNSDNLSNQNETPVDQEASAPGALKRSCPSEGIRQAMLLKNPALKQKMADIELGTEKFAENLKLGKVLADGTVEIPVVFNVIYNTSAQNVSDARIAEQIPLKHAMKRVGKPEDLAETAKFLLSSNSSWITGQTIHVDGGKINLET